MPQYSMYCVTGQRKRWEVCSLLQWIPSIKLTSHQAYMASVFTSWTIWPVLFSICFLILCICTQVYNCLQVCTHASKPRGSACLHPPSTLSPLLSYSPTSQCPTPVLESEAHTTTPEFFHMDSWTWTQVLMLAWQTLDLRAISPALNMTSYQWCTTGS